MGNFVDHVKITCKAGNGGNGSMSFHREKFVLNGGPDGGDGGNGGNVCFYADLNMHTLLDFRFKSKYTAENGVDGAAGNCTGKRGEDLIIKVPVGTVIREAESGAVVADMDTAGETRTILHGGRGGWGRTGGLRRVSTSEKGRPNWVKLPTIMPPGRSAPRNEALNAAIRRLSSPPRKESESTAMPRIP